MARVPLTKEEVRSTRLALNFKNVGITAEQFSQLCRDNRDLSMELTAQKELIIMAPKGWMTGWRENILSTDLTIWAQKDGTGMCLSPDTTYRLPNGAMRGPDASWVRRDRLAAFTKDELEKFLPLCPDFVAEIMSPTDALSEVQDKMAEYVANGARLGWLIDPYEARVYIYRPGNSIECLENPITISGESVLSGFVFNVAKIRQTE
jgi:Uma2 family endonuclease